MKKKMKYCPNCGKKMKVYKIYRCPDSPEQYECPECELTLPKEKEDEE